MASTNKTTTLDLSQFVGTDKPDWLTDYNDDMEKLTRGQRQRILTCPMQITRQRKP